MGRQGVFLMKKLSTDHPFFEVMGDLGDEVILNVMFVLTSLPVITIGASLTALYRISLRRQRGESNYAAKEYFRAFREEWRQSTRIWLIAFFVGILLGFDIFYMKNLGRVYAIAIGIVVVICSFIFSYAFPLQARFQNTIKNTLKNALVLSVTYLPYTLLIVALNSIPAVCIAAGNFVTMMAMPVYCFVGFALTARINSFFFNKVFQKFMEKDKEEIS